MARAAKLLAVVLTVVSCGSELTAIRAASAKPAPSGSAFVAETHGNALKERCHRDTKKALLSVSTSDFDRLQRDRLLAYER
jgi:hypothetical protein